MKILWITNTPIGALGKKIYGEEPNGLWMSVLLDDFVQKAEWELVIATAIAEKEILKIEENSVTFYGVPNQVPLLYNENAPENTQAWTEVFEQEKPDLIQVWGTEFTHGLCALRAVKSIPSVVYMQGYLGSIARHYLAGISYSELKRTITLRDVVKRDGILQQQKKYWVSKGKEKEMLELAGAIICENDWCENSIRAIVPEIRVFRCPLSVNQVFGTKQWGIDRVEKHSIICTASGYPLKGLHMVLRAVALLKNEYPDIKLYIPGQKMVSDGSVQWFLRKRGYTKYIEDLIKKLGIEQQIIWMGQVSQERLAEQYERTHVFVLPSAIENHASSLKEAMMVGTPSVAASVGGVPEYVKHGENAFLYRFEEYEIMAGYIKKLFEDNDLAKFVSRNGRLSMKKLHSDLDIYEIVTKVYKHMLEGEP